MYVPRAYRADDRVELLAFVRQHNFGVIVSAHEGRLVGTHVPFVVREQEDRVWLYAHVARANPQWTTLAGAEVLVIFAGPHGYVSPSAYEKRASVPTWNYVAVHASGTASILQDAARLEDLLARLIAAHEPAYQHQWNDLPQDYRDGMLRGIVGLEIEVTRLEGQYKLSQNRSPQERERVAANLEASGDPLAIETAQLMREREARVTEPAAPSLFRESRPPRA